MFAIKNKEGKIIARCMGRLLWDKKAHQPVLMQERMYRANMSERDEDVFSEMLDEFVKHRAEKLKLSVYKEGRDPVSLESKQGRGRWEYVDSSTDKIYEHGIYQINYAKLVKQV